MSSGQYEILRPLVDERIQSLVRDRLLRGLKFFDGHALRKEFTREEAKLTLLLVRIANPKEFLTEDETALLEAGSRQMQNNAETAPIRAHKRQKRAQKPKRRKPTV